MFSTAAPRTSEDGIPGGMRACRGSAANARAGGASFGRNPILCLPRGFRIADDRSCSRGRDVICLRLPSRTSGARKCPRVRTKPRFAGLDLARAYRASRLF
jgi:hypothetical protein